MNVFSIDFESYYSKEYSITDLGNWGYTNHPEFDAYMVTIAGTTGDKFVGDPKDFDWECLAGSVWVSHNASFDKAVFGRLVELGKVAAAEPAEWYCTADLAVYLGAPRNLQGAALELLKVEMVKTTRAAMKGLQWLAMTPEFQQEVRDYAMKDAELCLRLWVEHADKWPVWERELSVHTREMCAKGLPLDVPGIEADIRILELELWKCRQAIPWSTEEGAKVLSPKAMAAECRKHGVEPPRSMAKDSEEFEQWLLDYGTRLPFAKAMSGYRRINALLLKFQTMAARVKADGWMPFGLKYGGAHTMRWSGDSGFNAQNMSRDPFFFDAETGIVEDVNRLEELKGLLKKGALPEGVSSVDMRKRIAAPTGYRLVVCDLSNIEPRCTALLSGDEETLAVLRSGSDIYEAHARATMGYINPLPLKQVDGELRRLSKTRVLGLGYGCGWLKFVTFAKQMLPKAAYDLVFGAPVTAAETSSFLFSLTKRRKDGAQLHAQFLAMAEGDRRYWVNSWKQVMDFRATNPKIIKIQQFLEAQMRGACGGDWYSVELPSGREMRYRKPRNAGNVSAEIPRLGRMLRVAFHGGILLENTIQATARDVFADCVLRLEAAGYPLILHAHDEAVCLVAEATAEEDLKAITKIMSTAPAWLPALPQAAEGHICSYYTK